MTDAPARRSGSRVIAVLPQIWDIVFYRDRVVATNPDQPPRWCRLAAIETTPFERWDVVPQNIEIADGATVTLGWAADAAADAEQDTTDHMDRISPEVPRK